MSSKINRKFSSRASLFSILLFFIWLLNKKFFSYFYFCDNFGKVDMIIYLKSRIFQKLARNFEEEILDHSPVWSYLYHTGLTHPTQPSPQSGAGLLSSPEKTPPRRGGEIFFCCLPPVI